MALSDYAKIMFDENGSSTTENGKFDRIEINPYKCWLYVVSEELWKSGEAFTNSTIAQIDEGEINLFGVQIYVKTVELKNKDGIPYSTIKLFYCQQGYGEEAKRYGGIVCYAYLNYALKIAQDNDIPADWGVTIWSGINDHWIECLPPNQPLGDNDQEWDDYLSKKKSINLTTEQKELMGLNSYCGITDDMINAFINWNIPDRNWVEKIKVSSKIYQNQGNAYFGEKLGFDMSVKVGEKDSVIFHKIIDDKAESE